MKTDTSLDAHSQAQTNLRICATLPNTDWCQAGRERRVKQNSMDDVGVTGQAEARGRG